MDRTLGCLGKCFPWCAALLLASCGGSGSNPVDSVAERTTLSVAATDPDGDSLSYQWRVTAGSVENRNAPSTVWTLPQGPGLHFAYVLVTDGRGGQTQMQYAVSTDALETVAPVRQQALHTPPAVTDVVGATARLRFLFPGLLEFRPPAGGKALERWVFMPDLQVQVTEQTGGALVFSGPTNTAGEVSLPKLESGKLYLVRCSRTPEATLAECGSFSGPTRARRIDITPPLPVERNLRLFGHLGQADGGVCAVEDEYFRVATSATVQLQDAAGLPLSPVIRANRWGDYALDAAVPSRAALKLNIACGSYSTTLDVPAAGSSGYASTSPQELSHQIPNTGPRIERMVANGPEGSVRGRVVTPLPDAESNGLPGSRRFLSYKGLDTRLSTCNYYRVLGFVGGCDAQGGFIDPITMEDWKKHHRLPPYQTSNPVAASDYINKMDLNLVRRMSATKRASDHLAFLVCNAPGPEGSSQREIDEVMERGLAGERLVACVGMEWTATPGMNNGLPFTKFVTFGPDGTLQPSVNLDGRGEKFLPGTCVACHGGSTYNGRFPERGNVSAHLGSGFLPFDTGNYFFGSAAGLGEVAQTDAIWQLNQWVRDTEALSATVTETPVTRLIDGWYARSRTLDKDYVPPAWATADSQPGTQGAARLYREIIGASCRTCHVAMGPSFDWDSLVLSPSTVVRRHVCGGTPDVAINASMPNALITRDRIAERLRADPALADLKARFLGCDKPLPDPVYPVR